MRSRPETIPVVVLAPETEWVADGDHVRADCDFAEGCRDHDLGQLLRVSVAMSIFGYEAAIVPDVAVLSANAIEMSPPPETA